MEKCEYNCGNKAKFTLSNGKKCCSKNFQSCPEVKRKNSEGLKKAHERGDIPTDTKHLDGNRAWNKGKMIADRKDYFCKNSNYQSGRVRKIIVRHNLIEYKCSSCNRSKWQGKQLSLELHHINGNNRDHRLENLEFLCPNCHSITENWRGKQNTGKEKVSDEKLIDLIPECGSIRQVCLEAGISGRGGNHPRIRRLIKENNVRLDVKKIQANGRVNYEKEENNNTNRCLDCDTKISWGANRCKSCEMKHRNNTKIDWPKTEWIEEMVEKYSYLALSRRLGVSDNGIRKRIRNHQ